MSKIIRLNKTNLRKVIQWSSSRYNELKKDQVIDRMLKILSSGEGSAEFSTGSFSERGHLGGWSYTVDGPTRTITRCGGYYEEVMRFSV